MDSTAPPTNTIPAAPSSGRDRDPEPAERARLARNVGTLLRRERAGRGITQRQLCDLAALASGTVARLESGRRRPSETMTLRLARALRAGRPPIEAAMLDLELQRAAGESLRRWVRKRKLPDRRVRLYEEAAARLAGRGPDPVSRLQAGMLLAVLDSAAERARAAEAS